MWRAPAACLTAAILVAGGMTAATARDHPPPGTEERGSNPPAPSDYVRMSDGTLIAVDVQMPTTYRHGKRYPTIFEMSGYDGASTGDSTLLGQLRDQGVPTTGSRSLEEGSRYLTDMFTRHYVTVHASVRGTGCSGGEFDLFSWRSALDGREVIEWIADQRWSNGKVGIYGHSYGGITGFMVAATRPPHLEAVSVSGLIDDLFRGITNPGGVPNTGFPLFWTLGIRPAYDVLGAQAQGVIAGQDPVCARNAATHTRTVVDDPIVQALSGDTDTDWWRARSLVTHAPQIDVPIHITGAWQDEQTGPRFPHLFELIHGVPKRMITTNGDHGTETDPEEIWRDRRAWMNHWIRGKNGGYGSIDDDRSSVVTLFEMHGTPRGNRSNGVKRSRTFPLEDTRWTDWYFGPGGKLRRNPAGPGGGSDTYLSGSKRQSWSFQAGPTFGAPLTTADGPDELRYVSRTMKRRTAVSGPITATLFMSSTGIDTELFVQLIDVAPDGSRTYVQRGMLRASHRAIDPALSDWDRDGRRRVMYRPFRPHTNPTPILPGKVYRYVIEVFPVSHVFRPGHRIMVKIHAPPLVDSYYSYIQRSLPTVNSLLHDSKHPSRIMLPVVPLAGVHLGPPVPCGELTAVRCVPGRS